MPDILVLFKGDDSPLDSLGETSDEYIALSAISRCYNSLRALHDNILQPAINYHQLWPIVQDYVFDKSNNLKELDVVKIMSALEGPIAGKAFGGTTLPTNLSTAWEKSIAAMEEKHNEKLLKNIAAARARAGVQPALDISQRSVTLVIANPHRFVCEELHTLPKALDQCYLGRRHHGSVW